jgi:uncharacterized Fe-S cluster-containing MiaB family protein
MKEITVNIEGKEFIIDLEKAKSLGVLKEDKIIKDFKVGDMYSSTNGYEGIIIVETGWKSCLYNVIGLCDDLSYYSDFGKEGVSREKMLEYLQKNYTTKHFVKNINNDFRNLVRDVLNNFEK